MKKSLLLLFVLAITFSFFSCKKYDDGPLLSLRTKAARMDNTWVIDKAYKDGIDVTSFYPADFQITITKDGKWNQIANSIPSQGTWSFSDKKETIVFKTDGASKEEVFTILRLKNDQLWLLQIVVNEEIEIHYIPKK